MENKMEISEEAIDAATKAGELYLEEIEDVEYDTLLSIFVAGAAWMATEFDKE